jgi:hypothetical protein
MASAVNSKPDAAARLKTSVGITSPNSFGVPNVVHSLPLPLGAVLVCLHRFVDTTERVVGELVAAGGLHLLDFFQKLVPVAVVAHCYLNAQIALWASFPFAPQFRQRSQAESPFCHGSFIKSR